MRVVIVGGGTGGHVTPLKPIVSELRKLDSQLEVLYVAQEGDRFAELLEEGADYDHIAYIRSGKYRRYPNESSLQRAMDVKTHLANARDVGRTANAIAKSIRILRSFKPDVVFGNGGFVSVPVGWAAANQNVPLVIHESDSRLGMASKILSSKAARVLFGMPTETTVIAGKPAEYVGIPLRDYYTKSDTESPREIRKKLGFDSDKPLITVAGSSLGAEAINQTLVACLPRLIHTTQIAHITGDTHLAAVQDAVSKLDLPKAAYHAEGFTQRIDRYFKASDIVVSRASATTFSELAALGKATILIPAKQLSDQQQNARNLKRRGAVEVIVEAALEEDPALLATRVEELLGDEHERRRLEAGITKLSKPNAAQAIAHILQEVGDRA